MEIVRLSLVALTFAVIVVILDGVNKEMAMLALVCSCGILLIFAARSIGSVFGVYEELASYSGIGQNTLKTVVKITLLCYVAEFAVGLIEDFGLKSLADKLSLVSKIIVVVVAAPVFRSLISVVSSLV